MKRLIVGLTGGIGSGKSAASDWFARQGVDVIDADVITHKLTQKHSPILKTLQAQFGDWVIDNDGNYNRTKMREIVFGNPKKLSILNGILHPAIYKQCLKALKESQSPYCILSVPLLFEGRHKEENLLSLCHHIIIIDVKPETQRLRASQRDGKTTDDIQAIMNKQLSQEERLALADTFNATIVNNDDDLLKLYQQLMPLHHSYLLACQSNFSSKGA